MTAERRIHVVWAVLVAATVGSWFVGSGHAAAGHAVATLAVLSIAFAKVRLVGIHFMEIGTAPRWLRAAFEGYVVVVLVALVALYLAL